MRREVAAEVPSGKASGGMADVRECGALSMSIPSALALCLRICDEHGEGAQLFVGASGSEMQIRMEDGGTIAAQSGPLVLRREDGCHVTIGDQHVDVDRG